mgnify:CR=1 FL=1
MFAFQVTALIQVEQAEACVIAGAHIQTAEAQLGAAVGDNSTRIAGVVESVKGKAQEAFGTAREKATDGYERARAKARELADEAPEYVDRARETTRRYADKASTTVKAQVQEQPVVTLLGGVAVGFLLGWLISGRRSE